MIIISKITFFRDLKYDTQAIIVVRLFRYTYTHLGDRWNPTSNTISLIIPYKQYF